MRCMEGGSEQKRNRNKNFLFQGPPMSAHLSVNSLKRSWIRAPSELLGKKTGRPALNIVGPKERLSKYLEVKNIINKMLNTSSYPDGYTYITSWRAKSKCESSGSSLVA